MGGSGDGSGHCTLQPFFLLCAWCIKFDKRVVTYVSRHSRSKGHKEDFSVEELEAAIELYEEHEEEDK